MSNKLRCQESVAVVLPSLDPDEKFRGVVNGLVEAGFQPLPTWQDAVKRYLKEANL